MLYFFNTSDQDVVYVMIKIKKLGFVSLIFRYILQRFMSIELSYSVLKPKNVYPFP
jgi:hypothetical protein